MQQGNRDRIVFLDYLRAIAIVCVVIVHAAESVYCFNVAEYRGWTVFERVVMVGLFDVGRMSVPFFFLISGYLLLARYYDDERCRRFWRRNWLPLATASSFAIVLVGVWALRGDSGHVWAWKALAKAGLFVGPVPCGILWFLPVMVGLYACIPVVAVALERFSPRTLLPPLGVAMLMTMLIPTLSPLLRHTVHIGADAALSIGWVGGCYGLYVIAGGIMGRGMKLPTRAGGSLALGSAFFLSVMGYTWLGYACGVAENVWYSSPLLFAASVCVFDAFSKMPHLRPCGAVRSLAACSFGIYVLHYPILIFFVERLPRNSVLSTLAAIPAALLVTWGIVAIAARCRFLARWVLLAK
ncbi:MAG: acyltransferase [Akkermansia sp.]